MHASQMKIQDLSLLVQSRDGNAYPSFVGFVVGAEARGNKAFIFLTKYEEVPNWQ
jgi:hypothetical protein